MAGKGDRTVLEDVVAVVLSLVFAHFDILNMVYLVPVLAVCVSRNGARRVIPVVVAGVTAIAINLFQVRQGLVNEAGRIAICISVFLPVVMWISALFWISLDGKSMMRRYLAGASAGALVALIFLLYLLRGGEAVMRVDHAMQDQFISLFSSFGLAGEGEDGVILAANLGKLYRTFVLVVGCMVVPIVMFFAGLNQFLALCMAYRQNDHFSEQVASYHLPDWAIWVFLGSWTLVCGGYFAHASYRTMALFLNLAGGVTIFYGIQGFAILLYRNRLRKNLGATGLFLRLFIIMAFIPLANTLLMLGLPFVGVTETWIQYRKPKELTK